MERNNPEVYRTFAHILMYAEKCLDAVPVLQRQGRGRLIHTPLQGRPDYWVQAPPVYFYVEAKDGGPNLNFGQIEQEQRDWMTSGPWVMRNGIKTWPYRHYNYPMRSFLWLWFGERIGGVDNPRRAYLIPWYEYLDIEMDFREAGLAGMAYLQAKELCHREAGLCAVERLEPYELEWLSDRVWGIPTRHIFWRRLDGLQQERFYPTSTIPNEVAHV